MTEFTESEVTAVGAPEWESAALFLSSKNRILMALAIVATAESSGTLFPASLFLWGARRQRKLRNGCHRKHRCRTWM